MSTFAKRPEVAGRVASAMRLGLALRHRFHAMRRTVSPAGIFSKKSAPRWGRRCNGGRAGPRRVKPACAGPELALARAELVVKFRAADQPARRLRGALGEPSSAGLHGLQYVRVAGGILQRVQVAAPI